MSDRGMTAPAAAPGAPEAFYRSDARGKVTGRAIYGVDLSAPGMHVGGLVRSTVAVGRIRRLDVSAARAMPGVTVVTAADLPVPRYGMVVQDQPPLASQYIRYAAEPVAAIAAPDQARLDAAIASVVLEVEPAEGVFDLEAAAESDAPLVHPDYADYDLTHPSYQRGNICGRSEITTGAVADAFATAALVVEGTYRTPRVHQGYLEPRACLASVEPNGDFLVRTSTQHPFGVRATVASILDVPVSRVRVVSATVGGGFGGKLDATLEHFACLLAQASGRPVKMMSSRAEEFTGSTPREDSVVVIRSALDDTGRIIARDITCLLNAGAYAFDTPFIASAATVQGTGPYTIEQVRSVALAVYTNTQPTGSFRGPTGPQMNLAVEAHMDEIARRIGEHPLELRRRHFFRDGDIALNGQLIERPSIATCLDRVVAAIDYDAPLPPGEGIGIACGWWTTTGGATGATVVLESDGTFSVRTGAAEIGSGALATGVVHLLADEFDVAAQDVQLAITADTGAGVYDFGAQGSRTTVNVGNAVIAASATVKQQVLAQAADLLEVSADDLDFAGGSVAVRGVPDASVSLAEVATAALSTSGPIHASARHQAPATPYDTSRTNEHHFYPTFNTPSFHCHAVHVAVDEATGRTRIKRYVVAQDVGKALVPAAVKGQIYGGVLQGIGMSLYEEEEMRDGVVVNPSFDTYSMPTIGEAPMTECFLVEEPSPSGPHGAKGVGEPPIIMPSAAIANALTRATGRAVTALPMTPARMLDHLAARHQEAAQ